jgi:hypothetical protein
VRDVLELGDHAKPRARAHRPLFSTLAAANNEGPSLYKRFVEIGRVVLISYGPLTGKLATVVDVVDQNRVRS